MTSEVVNLRERIEKVRAEMAGESNDVIEDIPTVNNNYVKNNQNDNSSVDKSSKSDLPDFKLTVQNPVSPRILLFLIIMQLITSITLVTVIYFK